MAEDITTFSIRFVDVFCKTWKTITVLTASLCQIFILCFIFSLLLRFFGNWSNVGITTGSFITKMKQRVVLEKSFFIKIDIKKKHL